MRTASSSAPVRPSDVARAREALAGAGRRRSGRRRRRRAAARVERAEAVDVDEDERERLLGRSPRARGQPRRRRGRRRASSDVGARVDCSRAPSSASSAGHALALASSSASAQVLAVRPTISSTDGSSARMEVRPIDGLDGRRTSRRPRRGRHPVRRAECSSDGRPRHRSRPGEHRLRRGAGPRGTRSSALDGGVDRAPRRRRARAPAGRRSTTGSATLLDEHGPTRSRSRPCTSVQNVRSGVRGRPGARRRPARRRAARHPVRRLHAPAGQGRGLRHRARRQGPGRAHGRSRCSALPERAAARPRRRRARRRRLPRQPRAAGRRGGWAPMIALVAGEVAVRRPDHVVVETAGGVGYRLAVSAETLRQVPAVGTPVSLHTHLVVRDDALDALRLRHRGGARPVPAAHRRPVRRPEGGARRAQRRPAARARRARSPPATSPACRPCPGIGKRTAERIVVELREKVGVAPERATAAPITVTPRRRPAPPGPRRPARAGLRARRGRARCSPAPSGETRRGAAAPARCGARA